MRAAWLAVLALVIAPPLAIAQQGTRHPTLQTPRSAPASPVRDTNPPGVSDTLVRGARDSLQRDSLHRDSSQVSRALVQWAEPDSVMAALLGAAGYTITRYQGKTVVFNAEHREIEVKGKSAAISHEQTILVADSILYNDSTKVVRARSAQGDTLVLRDPSQGTGDLVAPGGHLTYDVATKHGTGTNLNTTTGQGGQTWYVRGQHVGFRADSSTNGHPISYAKGGSITTDSMPDPDYHFQVGEVKVINKKLMVARPAVLYLQDIPVLWFPFIFQDMRSGRRSGILPPRVGLTDVIRTSSGYRRTVENLGYYFALNDYMDLETWLDWRSSNGSDQSNPLGIGDPGWTRYNLIFNYRWLDRFLDGGIQAAYNTLSDGSTDFTLGWHHSQQFSQRTRLSANINYETNTVVHQQQAFNVAAALAAISSQLNFQQLLGPATFSLGGTRRQYSGRTEVDQTFPTFSVTSKPINLASWLVWSPNFSMTNTQQFNLDQIGSQFGFRYFRNNGVLDSTKVQQNTRNTTLSFDTPLRIGNFVWRNSFRVSDAEIDFPTVRTIVGVRDTSQHVNRVFARSYLTTVDWDTGINLPSFSQGKWNITPSVQIVNVDPSGYWVRSERTGGAFVNQSKRLQYSLSISPTFYGLFPGFGPFTRIRHSISPGISYTFAPPGNVSDAYLAALGKTRVGYLGALRRSQVQLTLRQVIEAKIRGKSDTTPNGGQKLKLLQIDFSPIGWDFERAKATHGTGLSTTNFTYRLSSDLLPGFDLSVGYSLFQGDPLSDTAQFKPFRESISASFSIGRNNNPFATLQRLFGGATPPDSVTVPSQTVVPGARGPLGQTPTMLGTTPMQNAANGGWQATFNFSSSRQRPIVGGTNVLNSDPQQYCHSRFADPILYQSCVDQQQAIQDTGLPPTTAGGPVVRFPARSTLRANTMFNLTPRWAVQWGTGYDFVAHRFSDHFVTLQREFRDWLANFSFSSAPNGNFAFSFYIALKAAPDLKFDYNRRSYRP